MDVRDLYLSNLVMVRNPTCLTIDEFVKLEGPLLKVGETIKTSTRLKGLMNLRWCTLKIDIIGQA